MAPFQTCVVIFLVVVGSATKVSTSANRCPDGWSLIPWEFKCVKVVENQKTWSDSRAYCNDQGGELVVINYQKTNDFLKGLKFNVSDWSVGSYWTGGRYLLTLYDEGNETIQQLTWVDFTTQLGHHDENTYRPGADCVTFRPRDGGWTSVNCTGNNGFICQRPDFWQKEDKIHCDGDWKFYEDENQMKCVYISLETATWDEAKSWCHQNDGNLLIIPDSDTNEFATSLIALHSSPSWIGLKSHNWVNGEILSDYNAFGPVKKDEGTDSDCVDLHGSVWKYSKCSQNKHFFCEKTGFPGFEFIDRCPEGWSLIPWEFKCVRAVDDQSTWGDARGYCNDQGGELVVINYQETNDFLKGLELQDNSDSYWTGGRYQMVSNDEGKGTDQLVWVDNTTLLGQSDEHTHESGKDCVSFHPNDGSWKSKDCNIRHRFICQRPDMWLKLDGVFCERGWKYDAQSRKCFYKSSTASTWNNSSDECKRRNANLLTIRDEEKQEFASNLIKLTRNSTFWLGLFSKDNVLNWVTGFEWRKSEFTGFASNTKIGKIRGCINFHSRGFEWSSESCENENPYICEKLGFIRSNRCPYGWKLIGRDFKCVKVVEDQMTWSAARNHCKQLKGDLVAINTQATNDILKDMELQRNESYWMGGRRSGGINNIIWVDRTTDHYRNLKKQEGDVGDCVSFWLNDDYYWRAEKCDQRKGFICQRPEFWQKLDSTFCDKGWKYYKDSNKCIYLSRNKFDWQRAAGECKKRGGNLLTILNSQTKDFAYSLATVTRLEEYTSGTRDLSAWIGLKKSRWVNGEGLVYNLFKPNNLEYKDNDCALAYPPSYSTWRSNDCSNDEYYYCEKPGSVSTVPISSKRCPDGWTLMPNQFLCVRVFTTEITWRDARTYCQQQEGDLAVIVYGIKNGIIQDLTAHSGPSWWARYTNGVISTNSWFDRTDTVRILFSDKTMMLGQENYKYDPADHDGKCRAAETNERTSWSTKSCDLHQGFICERRDFWLKLDNVFCENGWKYYKPGNKCFYQSTENVTWNEAVNECRKMEANLLIIPDYETHEFATSMITIPDYQNYWIGLRGNETKKWVNGQSQNVYSAFAPWQGGINGCFYIHGGFVSDILYWLVVVDCSESLYYICEKPDLFHPSTTTTSTIGPTTPSTTTSTVGPTTPSTTTSTVGPTTPSTTTSTVGPTTPSATTSTFGPTSASTMTAYHPLTNTTNITGASNIAAEITTASASNTLTTNNISLFFFRTLCLFIIIMG